MPFQFDKLSPREFEELCLALLAADGHETRHLGAAGADGGWDIRSVDAEGRVWCTQCKHVKRIDHPTAVRELTKVLDGGGETPAIWALAATLDLRADLEEKLTDAAKGRCEIRCFGKSDLELWIEKYPLVRDGHFAGDAPHARIAYLSACKADRDLAAALRRDLRRLLRRRVGADWDVQWHDPTQSGLAEVPAAASWGIAVVSPEALADRRLLDFWKNGLCPGRDASPNRRRLLAVSVAPSVPWPDWLEDRFERVDLRSEPGSYRPDLSTIISKWIGETENGPLGGSRDDPELEGPVSPTPRLPSESYERLVSWLEPIMKRPLIRRYLAVSLGLEGKKALDDFPSAALQASAAIVLCRQDDDPVRAAQRLISVAREELEDEDSVDMRTLDDIAADLRVQHEQQVVDRGLLPTWLRKVARDHERLVDHFQTRDDELDLLDQVYVELEMLPDRFRDAGLEVAEGKARQSSGDLSLEDVLAWDPQERPWVTRRWVVRGDPGAGKTTLLRHLACKLASDEQRRWVPVFQSLPVLVRSKQSLLDRVEEVFEQSTGLSGLRAVLDREGQEGRLLVLLDGLDEVGPELRDRAESRLQELASRWPETPIVVSTRPIGYQRFSQDFRELQLRPLDRKRRLRFLAAWFGRAQGRPDPNRAKAALAELDAAQLDELTGNPLYLTLTAMLLEQGESPEPNRADLYCQVFDLLLEGKYKHQGTLPIERPKLVREALRRLAYTLTVDNRDTEPRKDLVERFYLPDLEGIRSQVRNTSSRWEGGLHHFLDDVAEKVGILGPHDGIDADWQFWHRTFKEALTAEYLATLDEQELLEQAAGLAGQESRWAEPFALLTGQVPEPDALVRRLVEANRSLGLRALATAQAVSDETLSEILDLTDKPEERSKVFEQLPSLLNDPDRALLLIDRLRRQAHDGEDLFWLYRAVGEVGESSEQTAPKAEAMGSTFFNRIPAPDPQLFRTFRTASGEEKSLWCEVEAGTYWVGSLEDERDRTKHEVRHQVVLKHPFWIAAIPITNPQYSAFDGTKKTLPINEVAEEDLIHHPRVGVSWYEAVAFCEWLATRAGLKGARLPSDAEWEVACRGGTETAYWSGDEVSDLDRVGWFDDNSGNRTHRVAEKESNDFGLYDVHGNVLEWVSDPSDFRALGSRAVDGRFPVDSAAHPADLAAASPRDVRVIRGGCFWNTARRARSAFRFRFDPWVRGVLLGFRVLLPFAPSDP